ncbi:MAG: acyl-CoA thioesterase [Microscillaceae bacterium]|nr:acyl-CoA thioesterase [Microscillaceae bacterium]
MIEFKPAGASKTTLTELMIPAYANFSGKIHGGTLLSLMDKVAYACAYKHAGNYCVTVSVNRVEFLQPVEVGDMIYMDAEVHYVGRSSMIIGIEVSSENFKTNTRRPTNSSYFTMVAKDDAGNPTTVPGLILETETHIRNFIKAMKLKELVGKLKDDLLEIETQLHYQVDFELLKKERCKILREPE